MLHTVQRAAVPGVMRAHRAVQSVEIETDRVAARRSSSWSSSAAVLLPARPREQRRGMEHCAGGVKQRSWPLLTIALEPPRRQWPPQRQKVHLRLPRPPRHRRRRSQPQPPVQPPTVMQARRQQYKPTFFAPCLPAQAATPCARSSYAHFVRITGIAAVPPAEAQPAHQGGECCSRGGRWRQQRLGPRCSRAAAGNRRRARVKSDAVCGTAASTWRTTPLRSARCQLRHSVRHGQHGHQLNSQVERA